MSLPVLPSAQQMTPALVRDYSAQVVAWAEESDDVAQVRDMSNKWAAITEYVRRTSREGIAEAEAALRRLEVRVGVLLGPAQHGGDRKSDQVHRDELDLRSQNRSHFRAMAEHPEVVEQVIAQSTDADPPSRTKVLNAIKAKKLADDLAPVYADALDRAPALERLRANAPDQRRTYLVTVRIRCRPDHLQQRLPIGFEVVDITAEEQE
jgi:hypothetical protein